MSNTKRFLTAYFHTRPKSSRLKLRNTTMPRTVPSLRCKYPWHTGSRWYTPELCVLSTNI